MYNSIPLSFLYLLRCLPYICIIAGVFEELVELFVPSLGQKLDRLGLLSLISLSWFLTVFLRQVIDEMKAVLLFNKNVDLEMYQLLSKNNGSTYQLSITFESVDMSDSSCRFCYHKDMK